MARPAPDRAALEIAHRKLRTTKTLDELLQVESLKRVVEIVATTHVKRRARVDVKKLQAYDND